SSPAACATYVGAPPPNLVAKPPELSWAEAACLPTAWLTAYRMLFTQSGAQPGATVLVQGAGGGVSTAPGARSRGGRGGGGARAGGCRPPWSRSAGLPFTACG